MLLELCRRRAIPDCEFFINKRDHPMLKLDLSEPYDFLFRGVLTDTIMRNNQSPDVENSAVNYNYC